MIDSKRHEVKISGKYLTVKIMGRGVGIPAKYTWPEYSCFIDSSLDEAYNMAAIGAESNYRFVLDLMAADERVQKESKAREEAYKERCRNLRLIGVKWGQQ